MSSFDESEAFEGASLAARAMAARPMPYLDELNPAQRDAVEALDGPVLMLAGRGHRQDQGLDHADRAFAEYRQGAAQRDSGGDLYQQGRARDEGTRVHRMLGQAVEGMPWLGTFHAICVKLSAGAMPNWWA